MRGDRRVFAALLAAALTIHTPAFAQDGDDWDYGENSEQKLSIAAVSFENFGVAVRCLDGNLSVLMAGLPAGGGGRRALTYRVGSGPEFHSTWVSARGGATAFALWPRAVARDFSAGGPLTVVVLTEDGPRRISTELPPSPTAVARVFQACGRDLVPAEQNEAPRDEDFAGLKWIKAPEGSFPSNARFAEGLAAVQCRVNADGYLRGCTAESEFPEGSGFGRAAVLAAHRSARVGPINSGDTDIDGRQVVYTMRYGLIDNYVAPPPSRLPNRDEPYNQLPPGGSE